MFWKRATITKVIWNPCGHEHESRRLLPHNTIFLNIKCWAGFWKAQTFVHGHFRPWFLFAENLFFCWLSLSLAVISVHSSIANDGAKPFMDETAVSSSYLEQSWKKINDQTSLLSSSQLPLFDRFLEINVYAT